MALDSASAKQAELLNEAGRTFVGKKRFLAAIDAYTEAITLCPNVAKYYTNRAICYRMLNNWTRVEADSRRASELDNRYTKAHIMLGLALVEMKDYAGGIKELEKEQIERDISIMRRMTYVGVWIPHMHYQDGKWRKKGRALNIERPKSDKMMEIHEIIARAKYSQWELLFSERDWKLENLKESCEKALTEYHFLHDSQDGQGPEELENGLVGQLKLLQEVFSKTTSRDMPTEVPDYLCCKITLELYQDPVISPSGITYERSMLIKHFQKVGNFDPITREPLEQHQLVPNMAIKAAVQAYLDEHPWAHSMA